MASMRHEPAVDYPGFEHDRIWRRLVAPRDYANPEPRKRYHLIVIGAGPAGLVTAIAAAGLGANVALIERGAMGGDCLNVGCVPSKSLLEFTANRPGDFDAAFQWLRGVRAGIAAHDSVERYSAAGVDVFLGAARFITPTTVEVAGRELAGRRVVIATGARAALPPVPGLADSRPLTNESVFDLHRPPKSLAILGGGPVGCELAQAFARLGVAVELVEVADRLLAGEAPETSDIVAASLRAAGVSIRLGARVSKVARRGPLYVLALGDGELASDQLLVAAGRTPNTDELNLAAVGVETDAGGLIVVDEKLRTRNPKIFAAGDVCSTLKFTHNADAHARIVVQNALFFPTATTKRLVVPHCTYTDPEIAGVGRTAAELETAGVAFDRYRVRYDELDRGRTQGDATGFVELLIAPSGGDILGATIVGRDAGEQIASVCLAIANDLTIDRFAKALLPYPTRAETFRRIADQYNRKRLTPRAQRFLGVWFRWTR
jgi:pyruvate/2-oxoglutarate dehydrogenase complex dihydrolipoamide dehydrogenase (E3) component